MTVDRVSLDNVRSTGAADVYGVLDELAPLLDERRRPALEELRARLEAGEFRVLVVGEGNRGKSTFINALLGRDVAPTGALPVTGLMITFDRGVPEALDVTFHDGHRERHDLADVSLYATEELNPENNLDVEKLVVHVDSEFLNNGLQLVDTPGTGSLFAHNTRSAHEALDTADAAIFVFSADPPLTAAEAGLLGLVRERAQVVLYVLNKVDYLSPADLARVHEFTVSRLQSLTGEPAVVYDLSAGTAIRALRAADHVRLESSGLPAFLHAFRAGIDAVRDAALPASIAGHTARLIRAEVDEASVGLRVMDLHARDDTERIGAFAARLAQAQRRQEEIQAVVDARRQRIVNTFTESSEALCRELSGRVVDVLQAFVNDEQHAGIAPRELEEQGRVHAAQIIRDAVIAWQREQAGAVQGDMAALTTVVGHDIEVIAGQLREAGMELLGVRLAVHQEEPVLEASRRFHFDFSDDAGPTELLAGAVRRHLPGNLGRKRALAWLERDATDLVEQHAGRARADLQERATESYRRLSRESVAELGATVDALLVAVERATAAASDESRARDRAELTQRLDVLRALRARLGIDDDERDDEAAEA